jgi:hypothetical protein
VAADLGFGHAPTQGLHDAGAVGHKDAPVRGRHHPAHDGDVLVVERARVEADPDLARAGIAEVGHVDQFQPVEPARLAQYYTLYPRPRSGSEDRQA